MAVVTNMMKGSLGLLKVKCLETDIITVYTSGYYRDYQDNLCIVYAHVQRQRYTGVGNGKGILPLAFVHLFPSSLCLYVNSPQSERDAHLVVVVEEGKEERGVGAAVECQLLQVSQHRAIQHVPQSSHIAILLTYTHQHSKVCMQHCGCV